MACGACRKAKARRQAALEARRAALAKKEADKMARAAAAQKKQKAALQIQQEKAKSKTDESA